MFQDMSQNIFLFLCFFQPFKNEKKFSHYELYKNRGQGLVPWPRFADPWLAAMRLVLWIKMVHWAVKKKLDQIPEFLSRLDILLTLWF